MARIANETQFEEHIVSQLVANGYLQRNPEDYDRKDALLKFDLIDFLKDTQMLLQPTQPVYTKKTQ